MRNRFNLRDTMTALTAVAAFVVLFLTAVAAQDYRAPRDA